MSHKRLAVLAASIAVLGGVLAATRTSSAGSATPPAHQITVNGSGSVQAVPDQVAFSFGVQTSAKTASAALAANAAAATKVIAALKAAGIAAKDIQTQQVSLSQRLSDDGQTVLGYNASSSVSATLPSIAKAGEVIDAAVAAGADTVDGPALTLSNQQALEHEALAAAVQDAKGRAQALADAAGVSLGSIVAITESGASTPMPFGAKTADAAGASVPIEPGTQEVQAFVSVTFATT
jgi:uncharacterized protein YggE